MKISNQSVLITGAAGGFGRALVKLFVAEGCHVLALDINDTGLKSLKSEFGTSVTTKKFDVADPQAWESLKKRLHKKRPTIWINNAGLARPSCLADASLEELDLVLRVSLMGSVYGTRLATQEMNHKKPGVIVNVSSVSGHIPSPYLVSYSTAKHGLVGLTRGLQHELMDQKSKINTLLVSPGFAKTPILKSNPDAFQFPEALDFLLSEPESVAEAILKGIQKNKSEIFPGASAPLMLKSFDWMPQILFNKITQSFLALSKK